MELTPRAGLERVGVPTHVGARARRARREAGTLGCMPTHTSREIRVRCPDCDHEIVTRPPGPSVQSFACPACAVLFDVRQALKRTIFVPTNCLKCGKKVNMSLADVQARVLRCPCIPIVGVMSEEEATALEEMIERLTEIAMTLGWKDLDEPA